jgi:AAA ATPase domain
MMKLPNPYTPGQPARVLGGRAREKARITERLERVAALGEYGGPLLVFQSPRGIGKTSLLRSAERDAAASKFVTVWVSASGGSNLLAELVYATRGALDAAPFINDKAKAAWSAQVTKLEVQLGVPLANAKATLEPKKGEEATVGGLTATAAEAPISALVELLHSAAALIRSSGGSGLIVFVDEVHAANTKPLGIVLNALQNLDGSPTDTAVTAVFAGLPAAPEVLTSAATFRGTQPIRDPRPARRHGHGGRLGKACAGVRRRVGP